MQKAFKFLTAAALLTASLAAQAQLVDKKALTLAEARKAVVAATAEAKANGWNVVIVVADDAGYPLTIDRLDNAQRPSVDIAIGKARTAALFKRPSAALEEAINKGRAALLSVDGQVFLQGGVPIVVNGEVIGAVGVSGVRADQDEQVATAGAKAINR
ncbi:MAG: heme-binding protein [Rhodocyclales bacterium GT-UBC]|nr:MAG: heme-binding protein [Rhodocyclales bacterium GT-UBC]